VLTCPLCGASGRPFLTAVDRNRGLGEGRFAYLRCGACDTVYMSEVPVDLARFYVGDYYGFDEHGEPPWTRNELLARSEAARIELLLRHVEPSGQLVEVGAGPGGFASAARAAGFDVTAIEMDARCCEYLTRRVGVRAIRSDDPEAVLVGLPPARVIALWHVLEHLADPAGLLARAAERLEPGGVLALGVPNPDSLQFRLLRSRWAHLDAPRHLCLMPAAALIAHADGLGLHCVELTTADPFGEHSNMFGWASALRRDPSAGPTPGPVIAAAQALTAVLGPVERRGLHGAALTLLLRKDD
jgi:SAM-dependent methyltransferase